MTPINSLVHGFKRVHKAIARRMFDAGYEVKLLPCKVNSWSSLDPTAQGHFWVNPVTIKKGNPEHLFDDGTKPQPFTLDPNGFESTVNAYRYYNGCAELGYYPHYYVTSQDYDMFCTNQFSKE